uniref:Chloroplast 50S ribosomal protein L24 n=1 Tax=Isochrysis galbana TaxID=37099 RepID=Q2IA84_ISOGA|nr:chloroplast 50S ribosomal protein L24 [Isochrysis galbana]
MAAAKIRTGDMVKVLAGDGKGTVAKVIMLDPKKMTVTVEGVNMQTKHMKPMKEGEQGRIIKRERPMHLSNVAATGETAAQDAAPVEAVAKE